MSQSGDNQLGLTDLELKFLSQKLISMEKGSQKTSEKVDQTGSFVQAKEAKKIGSKIKIKVPQQSSLKKQCTEEALKAVRAPQSAR